MTLSRVINFFKKDETESAEVQFYHPTESNYFESFYPLVVEDNFRGTIVCLEDVLVKKNASFSGELICRRCVIEGTLKGNILAIENTGIGKSASLDAGVLTGSILIANQAAAVGELRINKAIHIPESFRKLEQLYQISVKQGTTSVETLKVKKIILKQGSVKTSSRLSRMAPLSAAVITELEKGIPEIYHEQPPLVTPEEKIENNDSSGWW